MSKMTRPKIDIDPIFLRSITQKAHALRVIGYLPTDIDHPIEIRILENKRSNVLNAKMWATLKQLEPIDWYGTHLIKEEWKDVITASLKRLKVVPGIDGGFVVCGQSTKNMPSKDIWDVIETAYSLGAQRGIRFIEPIEDLRSAA